MHGQKQPDTSTERKAATATADGIAVESAPIHRGGEQSYSKGESVLLTPSLAPELELRVRSHQDRQKRATGPPKIF